MSAFCVFGVTYKRAVERAEKYFSFGVDERDKKVIERADYIFRKSSRIKISPEFDAPQFAEEFRDLATKTIKVRSAVVMGRFPKKNKSGDEVISKKTGKVIFVWREWK